MYVTWVRQVETAKGDRVGGFGFHELSIACFGAQVKAPCATYSSVTRATFPQNRQNRLCHRTVWSTGRLVEPGVGFFGKGSDLRYDL